MQMKAVFKTCGIVLGLILFVDLAASNPEPAPRSLYQSLLSDNEGNFVELHQVSNAAEEDDAAVDDAITNTKATNPSTGRLFLTKYLMSSLNNNRQQPTIPIIITGAANTATATTSPTVTITSTGTIPTATGTITTSPISRSRQSSEEQADDDSKNGDEINAEAMQAALQQQYIAVEQQLKEAAEKEGFNQQSTANQNVNLRRRSTRKGQTIAVRIPPKYRRYFRNGQRVVLNPSNRAKPRRVVRKRIVQNRRRNVRNKKNRSRLVQSG